MKKDGFKYIPGCFLIIQLDLSVDMTSVGLVKEIFVVDGNHIFYLQLFKIVKQNSSLNCLITLEGPTVIFTVFNQNSFNKICIFNFFDPIFFGDS